MPSALERDLEHRVAGCGRRRGVNYFMAYVLLAIGVGASAWATVAVAADKQSATFNAVLAALPGITVIILNTFKFPDRADWWNDKRRRMDSLYRGLRDENRDVGEVSRELTAFLDCHIKSWPSFGQAPGG